MPQDTSTLPINASRISQLQALLLSGASYRSMLIRHRPVTLAALQFVRKVSGYRMPSRINKETFDVAVDKIVETSRDLLSRLSRSVR